MANDFDDQTPHDPEYSHLKTYDSKFSESVHNGGNMHRLEDLIVVEQLF